MSSPRPPRTPRKPARKRVQRPPAAPARPRGGWRAEVLVVAAGLVAGLVLAAVVLFLDARVQVRAWLAAPPRPSPTRVWSAPIAVHAGEAYPLADLEKDLLAAGLERSAGAQAPGSFAITGAAVEVRLPGEGRGGTVRLVVEDDRVVRTEPASGVTLPPTLLGVVGDREGHRTPVRLAEVSPWVAPALLAIEDTRFREHVGVDPIGLLRALWRTLVAGDLQGGSTLTQQLAKNLFVGPERTVHRKVREVFYAAALERELDKDALLELYLSEVYLGHVGGVPIHGVEQAARTWFGKSAAHLTVAEAATIAGAIASPNDWSPLRDDAGAVRRRREQVIRRMVVARGLSEAEAEAALAEEVTTIHKPSAAWRLPWAVDAALAELDGGRDGEGAEVWTTVQPHVQRSAERAVATGLARLAGDEPKAADAEAAVVVVEAATGDVLAIVGGRSYARSPFHRALHARRQAGSTVKPLVVLEALRRDPALSPATLLDDAPIERRRDGKAWRPGNHDGAFLGPLPLQRALELSRNVPAVLLSERVGLDRVAGALQAAGLTGATGLPSTALGAFPTTPLELAGAYTAFPGGGTARRAHVLRAVTGPDGDLHRPEPGSVRLADPVSAALATSMLEGVTTHGTARRAGLPAGLAGKTGTTDGGRDAWFVGFDAGWVVAVWVGLDRGSLGLGGGEAALPVWRELVLDTGRPRGALPRPAGLVAVDVCGSDGRPACGTCDAPRTWWFRQDHAPRADCAAAADAAPDTPPDPGGPLEAPAPPRSVRLERLRRDP